MKILCPLPPVDDYEALCEAGADEFFAGYHPHEWLSRFGSQTPINRRCYVLAPQNIYDRASVEILARKIQAVGVPVKIAINQHSYAAEVYPLLLDYLRMMLDLGFQSFIVADPALILLIRKHKLPCKIHISGEMECTSHHALALWDRFDIARYVFPRKTTIAEMRDSIALSGSRAKEYEAFILNELCYYSGGLCNSIHADGVLNSCSVAYRILARSGKLRPAEEATLGLVRPTEKITRRRPGQRTFADSCGICRIPDLRDAGITHLKIVGRGRSTEWLLRDVKVLRKVIGQMDQAPSAKAFREGVLREYFDGCCEGKIDCYYNDGLVSRDLTKER